MSEAKITLEAWAAKHYDPAPSQYILRRWVRAGEVLPEPEKVGHAYYVVPNARRIYIDPKAHRVGLVERLKAA